MRVSLDRHQVMTATAVIAGTSVSTIVLNLAYDVTPRAWIYYLTFAVCAATVIIAPFLFMNLLRSRRPATAAAADRSAMLESRAWTTDLVSGEGPARLHAIYALSDLAKRGALPPEFVVTVLEEFVGTYDGPRPGAQPLPAADPAPRRQREQSRSDDLRLAIRALADLGPRTERPVHLSGVDLTGLDLTGIDLTGFQLRNARLGNTNLTGATLTRADLSGSSLNGVQARGARFAQAVLNEANFAGGRLADTDFSGVLAVAVNFASADLRAAKFARASVAETNFSDARMTRADLGDAYVADCSFAGADLIDTIFTETELAGVLDFAGANVNERPLTGAKVRMIGRPETDELRRLGAYLAPAALPALGEGTENVV
ncbi:pentapeptide repeat-containing protein [Amycolatopsis sp. NPDC048633]|uniref:pentapeptide repeat-containing protein n=1 Tax=Amycolatopsis sp. NPDC048633 TaxID=3157095 RepID=UPI003407EBCF